MPRGDLPSEEHEFFFKDNHLKLPPTYPAANSVMEFIRNGNCGFWREKTFEERLQFIRDAHETWIDKRAIHNMAADGKSELVVYLAARTPKEMQTATTSVACLRSIGQDAKDPSPLKAMVRRGRTHAPIGLERLRLVDQVAVL